MSILQFAFLKQQVLASTQMFFNPMEVEVIYHSKTYMVIYPLKDQTKNKGGNYLESDE
jgi:hypothetical protein